jgi:hypothetical protein
MMRETPSIVHFAAIKTLILTCIQALWRLTSLIIAKRKATSFAPVVVLVNMHSVPILQRAAHSQAVTVKLTQHATKKWANMNSALQNWHRMHVDQNYHRREGGSLAFGNDEARQAPKCLDTCKDQCFDRCKVHDTWSFPHHARDVCVGKLPKTGSEKYVETHIEF